MDPVSVDVVLVSPERPANVAAACRAMKNMGLGHLVLVNPPEGLDRREVRSLAYGAWDVLDDATTAANLEEAVAGCTLVVGTCSRPGPDDWTPRRLALEGAARAAGGRVALVFGPEARGLRNAELARCHVRVRIPAHESQPSLNLAQAVLIVAYEIFVSARGRSEPPAEPRATAGQLEQALEALRAGLLGIGYLNPQNPEGILAELRGMLARAGPSRRELDLLQGVSRQLLWASAEIARVRRRDG
jgi:tRNA (cytidine32/uridine32-2'-O)-methyltransferase